MNAHSCFVLGMIEMVTNSETLRKIQVELGLTGSFKDRPIAEWLAKHNPSALEYEIAIKNFTGTMIISRVDCLVLNFGFYSVVCGILCGNLRPWNLRPPQRQHHAEDFWSHVPHRLWEISGRCANVWKFQKVIKSIEHKKFRAQTLSLYAGTALRLCSLPTWLML